MKKMLFLTQLALCLFFCQTYAWQTIDEGKLQALTDKAEKTHSEAIIVYHNNRLVTEKYFGSGHAQKKIEAMSCTKSIVGLAVACLLSDGDLNSLDTPVHKFYPEWNQGMKKEVSIKHLVQMTSGIQNVTNAGLEIYPSPDFVKLALAAELSHPPGEVFSYNNKALNLMAGVIKQITGQRMDQYIGERLFAPLGITEFSWSLDEAGNPHVMSGCRIKPADFVKLGLLVLNQGKVNGKEVISAVAMQQLTKPGEQYQGYGLLWWLDYEKAISVIDEQVFDRLRAAKVNEDFISRLTEVKGRYNTQEELFGKMTAVFGPQVMKIVNEALAGTGASFRRREFSGQVRYRADGYLGNFIAIDPNTGIVAVRMISHESHQDSQDNFSDFTKMVFNLTRTD